MGVTLSYYDVDLEQNVEYSGLDLVYTEDGALIGGTDADGPTIVAYPLPDGRFDVRLLDGSARGIAVGGSVGCYVDAP